MTFTSPITEIRHDGGFLVSKANGHRSLDQFTLTGAARVLAGTILGLISVGNSATAAALGTNTGNGTFGAITTVSTPTQIGVYALVFTDATHFTVTAPNGQTANGQTGVAFSALGIGFTITAGGTAFVAGDGFTITTTDAPDKPTAVAAANGGNTGNGTSSAVTTTGHAPKLGVYTVEFDDATHYVVSDPTGIEVGHGVTGTAFSGGGLGFTITAGGTAFVAGDSFAVTVAPNANANKYVTCIYTAVDGSQVPAAILYGTVDATLADQPAAGVTRAAEVNASELIWDPSWSAAAIAASGLPGLIKLGIIPR
jgi:hypothetical protein